MFWWYSGTALRDIRTLLEWGLFIQMKGRPKHWLPAGNGRNAWQQVGVNYYGNFHIHKNLPVVGRVIV